MRHVWCVSKCGILPLPPIRWAFRVWRLKACQKGERCVILIFLALPPAGVATFRVPGAQPLHSYGTALPDCVRQAALHIANAPKLPLRQEIAFRRNSSCAPFEFI